ncbi:MAG: hypothetical protein NZ866_01300 [Patescibacteria group bacterium]|nr:hypothetical protein [Patescibacteria group bacterium]
MKNFLNKKIKSKNLIPFSILFFILFSFYFMITNISWGNFVDQENGGSSNEMLINFREENNFPTERINNNCCLGEGVLNLNVIFNPYNNIPTFSSYPNDVNDEGFPFDGSDHDPNLMNLVIPY